MKQSSDFIRFHVSNDSQSLDSSKARKHMAGWMDTTLCAWNENRVSFVRPVVL
jgi:hypothetical protein